MLTPSVFRTAGGVIVTRTVAAVPRDAFDALERDLDQARGALIASRYEYPGRYQRWATGFIDPPVVLTARGRVVQLEALNQRGRVLLPLLSAVLAACPELIARGDQRFDVREPTPGFDERDRTRQPSAMSAVRALLAYLASDADPVLGLYGAFGFDLVHQLEAIAHRRARPADQRDIVLYLPDSILVRASDGSAGVRYDYDFRVGDASTVGLPRTGSRIAATRPADRIACADHAPGAYAALVERAMPHFARGDLFEVVPSTSHHFPVEARPSELSATLARINPSPYGFLINLGSDEWLIGASPEMFVRVTGRFMESCPISGTIRRGATALEDARQIQALLNSAKDEAELTMCTDVDRNDKARIAVPGSVRVLGRRQIEQYSHLIHTVDHVAADLAPGFDGVDAFLTHLWAVTVTGAPKPAALAFIEAEETSARRWYGGAIGWFAVDGSVNTGMTLRTMRVAGGMAEVRVGATVLADSDPSAEEAETAVKAAALIRTIEAAASPNSAPKAAPLPDQTGRGVRVLLVDCEDSFVHMLASYIRATGAEVAVIRHTHALPAVALGYDLVTLSPGPGRPEQFGLHRVIPAALSAHSALFGVCLVLQAIGTFFGADLQQMDAPQHGRATALTILDRRGLFAGVPDQPTVGRYHSLHLVRASLPASLIPTAITPCGVVMAIEHTEAPIQAVQFHPESIMSAGGEVGFRVIQNVMRGVALRRPESRALWHTEADAVVA
jgi:anthranilate synthase